MRISVITACRNNIATIGDTLRSIASQTHGEIEHIVIDGASTDGTLEWLQAQSAQLSVLLSEHDQGIYDALNKGLARATGDVVGFLHSDDFFAHDGVLERVAATLSNPDVDAIYGDLDYVSQADGTRVVRRWRPGIYSPKKLAWGWMPPHPTFYVRRNAYEQWGGFNRDFRIAGDYDLMLKLLVRGGLRPVYIPEVLVKMRLGGVSNRSLSRILRKSREDYLALRRHGVGGLGALLWKNLSKSTQFI